MSSLDHSLVNAITPRRRALAAAVALALLPHASFAMMLGEPEVRSALGRPLDVRIPVSGSGADAADESCFALLADPTSGNPLAHAQLTVEQQAGRTYLRVRSNEAIAEPASILRVRAGCPPTSGVMVREYGILLDPVPASAPSAPMDVPDTARVAKVEVAPVVAQAESATATAPATAATPKPARHKSARAHGATHPPVHRAALPVAHGAPHGGYLLKLSGPVLDLEPTRHMDAAQRAQLREANAMMLEDDYTSAMLALRSRIDAMQKRLEELQLQAARIDAVPAATSAPVVAAAPETPAMAPPLKERVAAAARRIVDAAGAWALVALLALLALLWPLARAVRRRREDSAQEALQPAARPARGVETGRFAPPPPEVIAPETTAQDDVRGAAAPAALDDTEEAIRSARELYNSGERLQAAGVLRLAIEAHPERVAPWLPLFDLLMRERLVTEFGELARGFRALHGASPAWRTVQRAGQQIDPANPLYGEEESAHQAAA